MAAGGLAGCVCGESGWWASGSVAKTVVFSGSWGKVGWTMGSPWICGCHRGTPHAWGGSGGRGGEFESGVGCEIKGVLRGGK